MVKKIVASLAVVCALAGPVNHAYGWGVWGHEKINRGAILALPKEMGMFFYNHADYLTEEATAPDVRKHAFSDKEEAARHYINLENFNYRTASGMPASLEEARTKYGKDTLEKYGTLPWTIEEMMQKLTTAMKNKNRAEILFLAANLGHYIGDAYMPLHTTVNHDGQQSGQKGIHALWEDQLPELFGKNYSLYAESHYVENVDKTVWDILDSSFKLVGPLLYNDKKLRKDKPNEMLYKMGANGQPQKNIYGATYHSYEYAHVYHELLAGMVENQMRAAIATTASFWYTAWVNAGKPDLTDLDPKYVTDRNKKFYQEDIGYWKKGKVSGYKVMYDFPQQ